MRATAAGVWALGWLPASMARWMADGAQGGAQSTGTPWRDQRSRSGDGHATDQDDCYNDTAKFTYGHRHLFSRSVGAQLAHQFLAEIGVESPAETAVGCEEHDGGGAVLALIEKRVILPRETA